MRNDRLTTKTREALQEAHQDATRRGNPELLPEHVIYALLTQEQGVVPALLQKTGADVRAVVTEFERALDKLPKVSGGGEPSFTRRAAQLVQKSEDEAKAQGVKVKKGLFPWTASGRAIANGRDEGFTKLLFDADSHRILGGGIVGTHAGDMIGEVALAIEMGADEIDIGKTIHPHPTLGESIGMAAEVAHGSCTDLPPARR